MNEDNLKDSKSVEVIPTEIKTEFFSLRENKVNAHRMHSTYYTQPNEQHLHNFKNNENVLTIPLSSSYISEISSQKQVTFDMSNASSPFHFQLQQTKDLRAQDVDQEIQLNSSNKNLVQQKEKSPEKDSQFINTNVAEIVDRTKGADYFVSSLPDEDMVNALVTWEPTPSTKNTMTFDAAAEWDPEKRSEIVDVQKALMLKSWQQMETEAVSSIPFMPNQQGKAEEQESEKEKKKRLQVAKREIAAAKEFKQVFGVWVRKGWIVDEDEKALWDRAEQKARAKEEREQNELKRGRSDRETVEELKERLKAAKENGDNQEVAEERMKLEKRIKRKEEKNERKVKNANLTSLERFQINLINRKIDEANGLHNESSLDSFRQTASNLYLFLSGSSTINRRKTMGYLSKENPSVSELIASSQTKSHSINSSKSSQLFKSSSFSSLSKLNTFQYVTSIHSSSPAFDPLLDFQQPSCSSPEPCHVISSIEDYEHLSKTSTSSSSSEAPMLEEEKCNEDSASDFSLSNQYDVVLTPLSLFSMKASSFHQKQCINHKTEQRSTLKENCRRRREWQFKTTPMKKCFLWVTDECVPNKKKQWRNQKYGIKAKK
ncbi:uncharacterized protein MONOS_13319 [Monocercomonoides exilis]|uniref:uncharacterized protein n=1 Tax=Monocercomonoides exilis TaxID=2049356 RepID=UPI0035599E42|nr:hypothetical protein MONOS_13319 [Monocercomonoides exilis]|eukprot:MONOS_13319.1-p1 / transcript=MONOS_13319.1 / gene=MONOS_13319 / organism=Monocercomonoides_exilis_PA203 / gene_product=unspecified product / transcript_product=unspecified product / location=Mono_scaffold00808:7927-10196(+) / protein_length=602 / sequence_SO=supercontig / SO=protein_coding / is_pseudo=false